MNGANRQTVGTEDLSRADARQALRVQDLLPGDRLVVRTDQNVYHLAVIEPAARQVVLWGGSLFPNPVGVFLDGCSRDGRLVEIGAICVGCALELRTGRGMVVTGAVRSIGVHHG